MELVSDTPDLKIEGLKKDIANALRALSANLMRVTRGAGVPSDIERQTIDLIHAFTAYGSMPSDHDIRAALNVSSKVDYSAHDALWTESENNIIGGALAIAADRQLHGWSTTIQGTRGVEQMARGCEARENLRRSKTRPRSRSARRLR
jgi:hypothetical protein